MNSHAKSISSSYNNNNNGNNTCVVHQVIVFFLEAIGLFCSARGTQITNSSRDARACRSARVCVCVCVCRRTKAGGASFRFLDQYISRPRHTLTHTQRLNRISKFMEMLNLKLKTMLFKYVKCYEYE